MGVVAELVLVRHGQSLANVAFPAADAEGLLEAEVSGRDAEVPLTELGERQAAALGEWLGPARCSDEMAYAMGFADAAGLVEETRRLSRAIKADEPIAPADWARILQSTEVVFVSDLAGSGYEWSATTGWSDEGTVRLLRGLQRQLRKVIKPYYGKRPA